MRSRKDVAHRVERASTLRNHLSALVWCVALLMLCGSLGPRAVNASTATADTIPAGLSASEWHNIQGAVERATYKVGPAADDSSVPGSFEAINARQHLRAAFTSGGVQIVPTEQRDPAWHWGMTLRAYGTAGQLMTVEPVPPIAEGTRVEYRHGPLVEWYLNEGRGLEQGFTLSERPGSTNGGPLQIDLAVSGSLVPRWDAAGTAVHFVDAEGQPRLGYQGLLAWDATGQPLQAQLLPLEGGLRVQIEDRAAVYPLTIDPTIINETVKLRASDGVGITTGGNGDYGDRFGFSVATAGDTIVVGALHHNGHRGAAYVFVKPSTGWASATPLTETAKLHASDGAPDDVFGIAVAISGDTIVVGAYNHLEGRGAAYVFVKPSTGWTSPTPLTENAKLLASDGLFATAFGFSVAIAEDTVVVGAQSDRICIGAAYVFVKPSAGWTSPTPLTESAKLLASDSTTECTHFGWSVAIARNIDTASETIVVGVPFKDNGRGAAYVYVRPSGGWPSPTPLTESTKLLASDGVDLDQIGTAVAIAHNTIVVGAPFKDNSLGAAYVYVKPSAGWASPTPLTEGAKLLASNRVDFSQFGTAVAIIEWEIFAPDPSHTTGGTLVRFSRIVVGTPYGLGLPGTAYLFMKPSGGWTSPTPLTETAKLLASDGVSPDRFGSGVAGTSNIIVVGAPNRENGRGAVYLFSPVLLPAADTVGPLTATVQAVPNPVSVAQDVLVSATIDDSATGGSAIAAATYQLRDSTDRIVMGGAGDLSTCSVVLTGTLCPTTTGFDQVQETVAVSLSAAMRAQAGVTPGVYTLCVRGQDALFNLGAEACTYLVVYDPDGAYVTGGGWIRSSPGFCTLTALCASAQGMGRFAFVSAYQPGTTVPSGRTQFAFLAGQLNFKSTVYEWLVVSGAQAQFKGSGTINGVGDYGFLLTAKDSAIRGGPTSDTFRIKIWEKSTGVTVYDNGTNQPIEGGTITIH